jgi:hypothetical protein
MLVFGDDCFIEVMINLNFPKKTRIFHEQLHKVTTEVESGRNGENT